MDLNRLHYILNACTVQLRKGDAITKTPATDERPVEVIEIFAMPHASEAPAALEQVDMEFLTIGVDKAIAETHKGELIDLLCTYPQPDRLAAGPSYIEIGGEIGDQGAAFQLFAIGKVLGLWDVITPARMGFEGEQARQMAGMGYVMITGFQPPAKAA